MARIALGIEYDGSGFFGWQRQTNVRSVQAELNKAITKVANHNIDLTGSGRTDTGVHAVEQVAHFDTNAKRAVFDWLLGINSNLPEDIRVHWVKPVEDAFHARFSAKFRHYRYFLHNSSSRPSLLRKNVAWYPQLLDCEKMLQASTHWIGVHDFSSFRGSDCQSKSPVRNITKIDINKVGDLITIDVVANAFLHHMVRNLVGTLIKIGEGKKETDWAKEVLLARDRRAAGITASPCGLYLFKIIYDF